LDDCPRLDFRRVLSSLRRVLTVYIYGVTSFLFLDIIVFKLFSESQSIVWRVEITLVGLILTLLWLASWWFVIKHADKR
jgi:hypothetical protein